MTQIRIRPTGIAGLAVAWTVHELEAGYAGAKKLLGFVEDPGTHVEINADPAAEDWQPAPTIEQARAKVAKLAPGGVSTVVLAGAIAVPEAIQAGIRQHGELLISAMVAGKIPVPDLEEVQHGLDQLSKLIASEAEPDDDNEDGFASMNTNLPTAEPTLERDPADTTPAKSAPQEGTAQLEAGPEEDRGPPPPAGDPSNPAPDTPDAKADDKAKAKTKA